MSGVGYVMISLRRIEFCMGGALAMLGVWILIWRERALSTSAFDELVRRGDAWGGDLHPATAIGIAALFVGTFHMAAVFVNGRGLWWTPAVRAASCAFGIVWMANWAHGFAAQNIASTAVLIYSLWCLLYFFVFWRALDRLGLGHLLGGVCERVFNRA